MLTSGHKSQYGIVYLDGRDWFLVIKFRESVGSFVGVMLEPFAQPPHNSAFASNICPTSFQLLLNGCWSNVETVLINGHQHPSWPTTSNLSHMLRSRYYHYHHCTNNKTCVNYHLGLLKSGFITENIEAHLKHCLGS